MNEMVDYGKETTKVFLGMSREEKERVFQQAKSVWDEHYKKIEKEKQMEADRELSVVQFLKKALAQDLKIHSDLKEEMKLLERRIKELEKAIKILDKPQTT